ncbi:histidine kinase dimerization/phospho-acceptor domain-containing protein [Bacillus salitolerans]|uniref:histidine kinase n=1 Tax=Bacillus salitolerans TaxID=1437434 RepID=A0ABW4LPR7_9BACI
MKLQLSLQTKYLLIIVGAILTIPFLFTILSFVIFLPFLFVDKEEYGKVYSGSELEEMWHYEARKLDGTNRNEIKEALARIHGNYEDAGMFWVDDKGITQFKLHPIGYIPDKWTAQDSIAFMKKSYGGDPFTVVAFINGNESNGFMVFQMPRTYLDPPMIRFRDKYTFLYVSAFMGLLTIFLIISWLFFKGIRKRLIRLQEAMSVNTSLGIPKPIHLSKRDEVGKLEESFNNMIKELEESRKKEKQEEQLRHQLIANLSHDLRTPLTVLRGNLYSLKKEIPSKESYGLVDMMDERISYVSELIDNLLSYTLLTSGKYPYHSENINIVRLLRSHLASWYPLLEEEGFTVEIELPEQPVEWIIDEKWFKRIIDNVLQNVMRYARSGNYVNISLTKEDGQYVLVLEDHGPGMEVTQTNSSSTGIGLTIISMMTKEMNIVWNVETNENGTKMIFFQQ